MYSISETAMKTGFTAHTLRYYEKIGLLSSPLRKGGKEDIQKVKLDYLNS